MYMQIFFLSQSSVFNSVFEEQKFLILMQFSLSVISFIDCAFDIVSKK